MAANIKISEQNKLENIKNQNWKIFGWGFLITTPLGTDKIRADKRDEAGQHGDSR